MTSTQTRRERDDESVTVREWTDRRRWNGFLEVADGPVYATWEWIEMCRARGHEPICLGATEAGDLVGVLPLIRMESLVFGDRLVSMPFSEYGSVVTHERASDEDAVQRALFERARRLADEYGVDFVSLRGREAGDVPGYERKQRFVTFEVPLSEGSEAVWDGYTDFRRDCVEEARDTDLTCRVGDSLSDLQAFYDLYLQTMRGHGSPPLSFAAFRRLWETLGQNGNMRLSLAELDGEAVNAHIDFAFGDDVYQWKVVSDYDYRDLDGGSLLNWQGMEWAANAGYDRYHFGRTREGSGVYMFKKGFGGEKTWLTDYHYFPDGDGELPDPESDRYDKIKQAWRKLPIPVTRIVGPPVRNQISL